LGKVKIARSAMQISVQYKKAGVEKVKHINMKRKDIRDGDQGTWGLGRGLGAAKQDDTRLKSTYSCTWRNQEVVFRRWLKWNPLKSIG
jgi:hypothetical protein